MSMGANRIVSVTDDDGVVRNLEFVNGIMVTDLEQEQEKDHDFWGYIYRGFGYKLTPVPLKDKDSVLIHDNDVMFNSQDSYYFMYAHKQYEYINGVLVNITNWIGDNSEYVYAGKARDCITCNSYFETSGGNSWVSKFYYIGPDKDRTKYGIIDYCFGNTIYQSYDNSLARSLAYDWDKFNPIRVASGSESYRFLKPAIGIWVDDRIIKYQLGVDPIGLFPNNKGPHGVGFTLVYSEPSDDRIPHIQITDQTVKNNPMLLNYKLLYREYTGTNEIPVVNFTKGQQDTSIITVGSFDKYFVPFSKPIDPENPNQAYLLQGDYGGDLNNSSMIDCILEKYG